METSTPCPRCGSRDVLPIVYGMPGPELIEEFAASRVALGRCVVFPEAPTGSATTAGTTGAMAQFNAFSTFHGFWPFINKA